MSDTELIQGDENDTRRYRLTGVSNLNAVTSIAAVIWQGRRSTGTLLTVTIIDAAERIVEINYGGTGGWLATAAVGKWKMQIKTEAGAQKLTWPARRFGPHTVHVGEQGKVAA